MRRALLAATACALTALAPSAHAATIELTPRGHAVLHGTDAPAAVRKLVRAANRIATKPYRYGGGHARFEDSGYDCSGSTSYALHGAGKLDGPLDSKSFMKYGRAGPGRWVTIYAKPGWVFITVAGTQFNVEGLDEVGSRWFDGPLERGFTVRHPPGL